MLKEFMFAISDHGNALVSKSIVILGYIGIGVGTTGGIASGTAQKVVDDVVFGLPDWAATVAIVSGLSLVIKNGVDTYYKLKDRREMNKEHLHKRKGDK